MFISFVYRANPVNEAAPNYFVWAAAVTEVEIDALTGEKNVLR